MIRLIRRLLVTVEQQAGEAVTPARLQAEMLLDETREELVRADSKASMLLSAAGIVVAALLAAALGNDWDPTDIENGHAEGIFWAGIGLVALGVLWLALAVIPRLRHHGQRESLAYFGHVVQYRSTGLFKRRATRRAEDAAGHAQLARDLTHIGDNTFDRVVDQVWTLSHIVQRKYRFIRWSLVSFGLATTVCVAALILDAKVF